MCGNSVSGVILSDRRASVGHGPALYGHWWDGVRFSFKMKVRRETKSFPGFSLFPLSRFYSDLIAFFALIMYCHVLIMFCHVLSCSVLFCYVRSLSIMFYHYMFC